MNNINSMKTENKSSWMIWVIAVLVVMNLTTILTVIYNRSKVSEDKEVTATASGMTESSSIKYSGRYFRDALGLSMEQMKKFAEFNPEFRQKAMAINRDLVDKRHAMLNEMTKKECDTARLNVLSDSIGYLHASLKKSTYIYYLNFKSICNGEQQKKLEQLFDDMFNNDTAMGREGMNARGGRRFGWRNNNN